MCSTSLSFDFSYICKRRSHSCHMFYVCAGCMCFLKELARACLALCYWRGLVEKSVWLVDLRWKKEVRNAAATPRAQHGGTAMWNCMHVYERVFMCVHLCMCICVCLHGLYLYFYCILAPWTPVSAFVTFSHFLSHYLSICLPGFQSLLWKVDISSVFSCSWFTLVVAPVLINLQGALLLKDPPGFFFFTLLA